MQSARSAFSIDVTDLCYGIPHGGLFAAVRELIEDNGEQRFQDQTGITNDRFLSLLEFYLTSTSVAYDNKFYVQRAWICIGSSIAPVLSDVFLSRIDNVFPAGSATVP